MAEHRMRRRETPIGVLFAALGVAAVLLIAAVWWLVAAVVEGGPAVLGP